MRAIYARSLDFISVKLFAIVGTYFKTNIICNEHELNLNIAKEYRNY